MEYPSASCVLPVNKSRNEWMRFGWALQTGVGTVSFCDCVSILGAAHYASAVCHCHVTRGHIISAVAMAQNAAAETDAAGGVSETKDDVEYEDTNNHDEKKTSIRTSLLTKFDRTRNFFWDPSTKQALGRTWISWGTFYTIGLVHLLADVISPSVLPSNDENVSNTTRSRHTSSAVVHSVDLERLERSFY